MTKIEIKIIFSTPKRKTNFKEALIFAMVNTKRKRTWFYYFSFIKNALLFCLSFVLFFLVIKSVSMTWTFLSGPHHIALSTRLREVSWLQWQIATEGNRPYELGVASPAEASRLRTATYPLFGFFFPIY